MDDDEIDDAVNSIQNGCGFTNPAMAIVCINLGNDVKESISLDLGFCSEPEGKEGRLNMLAFALTIPEDMKP